MTEAEWAACTEPATMLAYINSIPSYHPGKPATRRLRLFACAVVRTAWDQLADRRCHRAVEVAERVADGLADKQELVAAREAAWRACQVECGPLQLAYKAAHKAAGWDAVLAAEEAASEMRRFDTAGGCETRPMVLQDET
jgi:hypothetical protein